MGYLDQARQAQAARARTQKKESGGLFGIRLPNLGVGQLFNELGAIPGGLFRLGVSLAPGGEAAGDVWSRFGKGAASSFAGTGLRAIDLVTLGQAHGFTDPLRESWASILGDEQYRPEGFERYRRDGILPGLVEDIGNVALAGAGAGKLARAGRVGRLAEAEVTAARAARAGATAADIARATEVAKGSGLFRFRSAGVGGELKQAGKAAAKAEGLTADAAKVASRAATLGRLHAVAHPYRSLFRGVIRPISRAGTARLLAEEEAPAAAAAKEAQTAAQGVPAAVTATAKPADQVAREALSSLAATQEPTLSPLEQAAREAAQQVEQPAAQQRQIAAILERRRAALRAFGNDEELVTLYRGEAPGAQLPGEFWTENLAEAQAHAAASGGQVLETQVPRSVVEEARARAQQAGHFGAGGSSALLLGPYWADLSLPLERPAAEALRIADPRAFVDEMAAEYARENGLPEPKPVNTKAKVDPVRGRIIANLYERAVSNPNDPAVQASYTALAQETIKQYQYLKDRGVQIEFHDRPASGGVYANEQELFDDIKQNRLKVDRTGPGEEHLMPQMNAVIDVAQDGRPVTVNDAFRAVHAYFGHSRAGNLFDRHGEDAAWRLHEQMFSPEARPALFTETVGQNSYLNFSVSNVVEKARGRQAQFPAQKATILPETVRSQDFAPGAAGPVEAAVRIAQSEGIPNWASAVVERLPDPAVRALAKVDRFIVARQTASVVRERIRKQDIDRRKILHSDAVKAAVGAATESLVGKTLPDGRIISPALADELIGDEVIARLDQTDALEWLATKGADDATVEAVRGVMEQIGARSKNRLPADWLRDSAGNPTRLGAAIDDAVAKMRTAAEERLETLRSTRQGERGLENVDLNMPFLSAGSQKLLKDALADIRRAKALEETRIPAEKARAAKRMQEIGDELSALGARIKAAQADVNAALREFDRTRRYVAPAFRTDDAWAAAVDQLVAETLDPSKAGATFDPHQNRLLRPVSQGGQDTGFAVGAVTGTAREVVLTGSRVNDAVNLAEAIDFAARTYQDLFQNPNVVLSTWTDEAGVVHVDVSEIVQTRDEALLKGAARKQKSVYDLTQPLDSADAFPEPVGRPDIAVEFLKRNTQRTRYATQLRRTFEKINARRAAAGLDPLVTQSDIDAQMAVNDIMAVAQARSQPGRFKHPDMVYATMSATERKALANNPNALFELALGRNLDADLVRHAIEVVPDLDKVAAWYTRTNEAIRRRFSKSDGTPYRITLGNGKVVDVPDLIYQLVAVTSIQQTPGINLGDALHALGNYQRIFTEYEDGVKFWSKLMDDFLSTPARGAGPGEFNAKSPRTLTELFERAVTPKEGSTVHRYWTARFPVIEILNGNTLDTWGEIGPDGRMYVEVRQALSGSIPKKIDRAKALERIDPAVVARLGEDRAVMEYYGQLAWAKVRSFYDNLRDPANSNAVTLDVWLARLLGADTKLDLMKPGVHLEYANQIRDLTDVLSEYLGRTVRPHELQAVLWAYAMIETQKALQAAYEAGDLPKPPKALSWRDFADHLDNPSPRLKKALDLVDGMAGDTFFQRFQDRILGATVAGPNRNIMAFFDEADPVTLVHEHAHALRQILGDDDLRVLERAYKVTDGRWTRAHEERFAKDFETYMATSKAPVAGLAGYFARIRTLLSEVWRVLRGRKLDSDVRDLFDNWFNPERREIAAADVLPTIPPDDIFREVIRENLRTARSPGQRAMGAPKMVGRELTAQEAYRRGITGGQAMAAAEAARKAAAELEARKVRLNKNLLEIKRQLIENTLPSQVMAERLRSRAAARLARIGDQLDNPQLAHVPAHWKPLWDALTALHREAETNPLLEEALQDLPQTWGTVLRIAAERGFDPTHVRSFQPSEVRQLVYEQVRLGARGRDLGQTEIAGTRLKRRVAQARTRSISALAAASVEATHELHTNALADFIEQTWARPIQGGIIPEGWVGWDAERSFLLTGEKIEGGRVKVAGFGAPTKMIPREVKRVLDAYQQDFNHPFFRALRTATDPWRLFVLTLSPRWYVNNLIGNVMLATKEGVSLKDWAAAWRSYRRGGPDLTGNRLIQRFGAGTDSFGDTLGAVEGGVFTELGERTVVPYPRGASGVRLAAKTGSRLEALRIVTDRIRRANEVVDELARVAVYHSNVRRGLSVEKALQRTYEAMVDYNDLSPFERQVVRAVVPFYAWQKGILKLVARLPIDHPAAVGVLMSLDKMNRELAEDEFGGPLPRYYQSIINLPLLGPTNIRAMNPFQDAGALTSPQGIASSLNPIFEIGVRNALGAPEGGFAEFQRMNEFGSVVPDTSPAQDVTNLVSGLPQLRLVQSFTGRSITGAPQRPPGQAAEHFAGVPTYTPEEVQAIIERVLKSQQRLR